ncbi:MAG TPA: lysophospholipid acyltransferase family protein [Terriglobales bacterium]|nr:lysophospholipid acyltransferase family protein [Terriglobales bacterium]
MPPNRSIVESLAKRLEQTSVFKVNQGLAKALLPYAKIQNIYQRVQGVIPRFWFERLLKEMRVSVQVTDTDLRRIPKSGSLLAVANHPFGILDGAALGAILCRTRPDVKVMTNFLLAGVTELEEHCIFVDPFGQHRSAERNRQALKQALQWLHDGHMLAVFPAGEVSQLQLNKGVISDSKWNPMLARLVRKTGAAALPVFFRGTNSLTFHALGLIHPELRTAWLFNEFFHQKGKKVEVRIGTVVPARALADMPDDNAAIEYLRRRTYLLSRRPRNAIRLRPSGTLPFGRRAEQPIAPEADQQALVHEVERLDAHALLEETREFAVFVAKAQQIPAIVDEIGRLREITFRQVGEGVGRPRDLDSFDDYYLHLFLWDKQQKRVAGAYRMGACNQILASRGPEGLYTSSLFHFQPAFFQRVGPALELGRSFVVSEYQRKFAPLLLLWKGIGAYVARNPETPVLFGAVSISRVYSSASRELIVKYFESRQPDTLAQYVRPRRPFRPLPLHGWDCAHVSAVLRDLEDLGDSVSDLETDAKGIPVLVRQYVKLGGTVLAFNVDPKFSDVLDGLVCLDLRRTQPAALERYMGTEGLARFQQYHREYSAALVASFEERHRAHAFS